MQSNVISQTMRILLVEDELNVSSFIKKGLAEQNYEVEVAHDGLEGKRKAREEHFDLIILDVMLPRFSGNEVCSDIRRYNKTVPVLMLTALGTLDDKVSGLEAGADDYLVKPFHFKELTARIKALTRRSLVEMQGKKYTIADLVLDTHTRLVNRAGKEVFLTAKEYALLELFILNQNRVLSRGEIAELVWGIDFDTGTNIIDVYVNYLRNKIEKGFTGKLIHTVIGRGYVMRED